MLGKRCLMYKFGRAPERFAGRMGQGPLPRARDRKNGVSSVYPSMSVPAAWPLPGIDPSEKRC